MPATTNYGWVLPTVNADFGAWGGLLNTAFADIDADLKSITDALDTRLDAVELEIGGALSVASVSASGNITAGANLTADALVLNGAGAANDTRTTIALAYAGADQGVDDRLVLGIVAHPSATPANRFVQLQSADNTALRDLALRASRLFIGTNTTPAFTSDEDLAVEGPVRFAAGAGGVRLGPGGEDRTFMELYARTATPNVRSGYVGFGEAAATILRLVNEIGVVSLQSSLGANLQIGANAATSGQFTATQFNGSGAGLTAGSVPQSAVASLVTDIANLNADNVAQNITIATKLDSSSSLNASNLGSGTIPAARYGAALGWPAQTAGIRQNVVVSGVNSGDTVTTSGGVVAFPSVGNIDAALSIIASALRSLIDDLTDRGVI